ncbi:MAG: glycogen synthase [Armatimonadetes bacterium]|nr:glycogen synthase [Armatimonadota bacterium]
MKILLASVEVEPFAKVGGLADVAGSLPKALGQLGHDVRVVMPAYGMVVNDPRWRAVKIATQIPVGLNPRQAVLADVYEVVHDGLTVWLIEGDHFFGSVSKSEEVYSPGRDAYLFYAQAALEACRRLNWRPDVVHANDWHTGFLPVFLREKTGWESTASVFTLHNLAYQGQFGPDTVEAAGLPWSSFDMDRLECWGGVNFLKAGCVYADQVNTVSPTYGHEIQTEEYGCGLWGVMRHLASHARLSGILNGIDVERHDPSTDPRIDHHFSSHDLTGKGLCRESLCRELGIDAPSDAPVLGVVSRLSSQKGFDLILASLPAILETGASLVMLAIGDRQMAAEFRAFQAAHPGRFKLVEAYDADLAQRVYAGIDVFLMPSSFEPCGLGQMFAMRYGSVPVVRRTGGLADTVFEGENGFVFTDRDSGPFLDAVHRAVRAYRSPDWDRFVLRCMEGDYGWGKSAVEYVGLYENAVRSRATQYPVQAATF